MSYAQDTGYIPTTFTELMAYAREAVNAQLTLTYTEGTFIGTGWYKYYYVLIQKVLQNETKTSEIFIKLQEYINQTNLRIQRPSVSLPGLIESFASKGYVAAVRKPTAMNAGKVAVCIDTDDALPTYDATRLEICNLLKDFVAGGMVFEGTEEEAITLTNGQEFDFKFYLPDYTPVLLRLTLTSSDNQEVVIPSDEVIRQTVFDNINSRYRLGWDFEPQRYYTQVDAPWAATILLEYSSNDGADWDDVVFEAAFDDLFTFELEDIAVLVDP